jgi:hypothetical protein
LPRAALIDERNRLSMSRFQLALWTILIVSAYLAAALENIVRGAADPLAIAIPQELWALLGISTVSLVGTPLILSTKSGGPNETQGNDFAAMNAAAPSVYAVKGRLVTKTQPELASWSDLFLGDETGDARHLDLSKIQVFFFTLAIATAYASALAQLFASSTGMITAFPLISQGAVALLGISHAGYLGKKAVPLATTT